MKAPPNCRAKKLGMVITILGSFCLFLDWEGANIRPQNRPMEIPWLEHLLLAGSIDEVSDYTLDLELYCVAFYV